MTPALSPDTSSQQKCRKNVNTLIDLITIVSGIALLAILIRGLKGELVAPKIAHLTIGFASPLVFSISSLVNSIVKVENHSSRTAIFIHMIFFLSVLTHIALGVLNLTGLLTVKQMSYGLLGSIMPCIGIIILPDVIKRIRANCRECRNETT